MNITNFLAHSLNYGLTLSLSLSALIVLSLRWNAEMWVGDYPPDIREKFGEMREKTKKQRAVVALLFFLLPIITLIKSIGALPVEATFLNLFAHAFIVIFSFNVIDLLILDWLLFVKIQPKFIILPGTEGMAGYKSYKFHFDGFLVGTVVSIIVGLITAGIALLII